MVKKKKLLITGASGFLGWNVAETAGSHWHTYGLSHHHSIPDNAIPIIQDITLYKGIGKLFKEIQPDAVIHTAAASNPNYCQVHPAESRKINVDASVHLAELCAEAAIPLVYTSTDLVFDGSNPPYSENSPVNPINIYSEQKVIAEERMIQTYPETTVCRMPLMFGHSGSCHQNFTKDMIISLINGEPLDLFSDEFRTPVDALSASHGLLHFLSYPHSLFHLGGHTRISRYNMGLLLADLLNCEPSLIRPIRQKERAMPAPRPADVSLDSSKAVSMGYQPDNLEAALRKTIRLLSEKAIIPPILQSRFPA